MLAFFNVLYHYGVNIGSGCSIVLDILRYNIYSFQQIIFHIDYVYIDNLLSTFLSYANPNKCFYRLTQLQYGTIQASYCNIYMYLYNAKYRS